MALGYLVFYDGFVLAPEHAEMMTYVLIYPMKTSENNSHHLRFNLSEFISEDQHAATIEMHLRYLDNMIQTTAPKNLQLIHEIVVDWSWAEINAVIRAFNNISVKEYLDVTFDIIRNNDNMKLSKMVTLLECSSHLTKTIKNQSTI